MKYILAILLLFFLVSCEIPNPVDENLLPKDATEVIELGNGWRTFKFDGNKYLHHKSGSGYLGYECLSRID